MKIFIQQIYSFKKIGNYSFNEIFIQLKKWVIAHPYPHTATNDFCHCKITDTVYLCVSPFIQGFGRISRTGFRWPLSPKTLFFWPKLQESKNPRMSKQISDLSGPEVTHKVHLLVFQLQYKLDVEVGELVKKLRFVINAKAFRSVVMDYSMIRFDISWSGAWTHVD